MASECGLAANTSNSVPATYPTAKPPSEQTAIAAAGESPKLSLEPEQHTVEQREPLEQRIAAARVFAFVSQDRIRLFPGPFVRAPRQNDSRAKQSDRDRDHTRSAGKPARADSADDQP
jgi:hypothetical protein